MMAKTTALYEKSSAASDFDTAELIGHNISFEAEEAYKLLRTNLLFSIPDDGNCRIIGISSSVKGEGKTTTSVNLAHSFSKLDKKVLLIEADMRLPTFKKRLHLNTHNTGLSNVLAGISELGDAITSAELEDGCRLYILPSGDIPPNPNELISSPRMEKVLEALTEVFDYIFLDLPPITAVSDSLAISGLLDGMVLVVKKDFCDKRELNEVMRRLDFLKVKVLGFVFTGTSVHDSYHRRYYRKYGRKYSYTYGRSYGYSSPKSKGSADKTQKAAESK